MSKTRTIFNHPILFGTQRTSIVRQNDKEMSLEDLESVRSILSPEVTKDLPDGWQNITTLQHARKWVKDRKVDSHFYSIYLKETEQIAGFMFLYLSAESPNDLRLGYLLGEARWGNGLATELINGLVNWAKKEENVHSIAGGVERGNLGSIRVLEKNGFLKSEAELPGEADLYVLNCLNR